MEHKKPSALKRFMPLIIFAVLAALLAVGLTLNPREVPSALIDKPAPEFELPMLLRDGTFSKKDLLGHVTLVNVWASWCFACRQEHEVVKSLSRKGVRIVGLNYKDEADDAKNWLAKLGNPYYAIVADRDGRSGIDWGVYGAPETFLIDKKGIIRHKVIGPLSDERKYKALMDVYQRLEK